MKRLGQVACVVALCGLLWWRGTPATAAAEEAPPGSPQGMVSGPDKGMPGTFDVTFPAGAEVKVRDVFEISRRGKVIGRGVVMFVHGNTATVAPSSDTTEAFKNGDAAVFLHAGDKIVANPRRPQRVGAGPVGMAVEVAHTEFVQAGERLMRLQITLHNASNAPVLGVVAHVKLKDINDHVYLAEDVKFGGMAGQATVTKTAFNRNGTFFLDDSFGDKATITPRRSQTHAEVRADVTVTLQPSATPVRPRPRLPRRPQPSPSLNPDE